MAKKKLQIVYCVVNGEGIQSTKNTFAEAEDVAKELIDDGGTDECTILEVTNAWDVVVPEEPQPEVIQMDLEDL